MIDTRFDRNLGVWDAPFQAALDDLVVGVAGLGGSGSYLVDLLARNGVRRFKLADPDVFEVHNIQRQRFAGQATLGASKIEATIGGLREINPAVEIEALADGLGPGDAAAFVAGCDFCHEAIDISAPGAKLALHRAARAAGVVATTSAIVGTGVSTFVFDPAGTTFEEYFGLDEPGLAETHRRISRVDLDYLDARPGGAFLARVARGTVPTTADGAFLSAATVAGVYKRLLMGKAVDFVPAVLRVDLLDDRLFSRLVVR